MSFSEKSDSNYKLLKDTHKSEGSFEIGSVTSSLSDSIILAKPNSIKLDIIPKSNSAQMKESTTLLLSNTDSPSHSDSLDNHEFTDGYLSVSRDSPRTKSAAGYVGRIVPKTKPHHLEHHEFPGWGDSTNLTNLKSGESTENHEEKLSEWLATAICGNDITSSCFYCTGLVVATSGIWAPVCMVLVAITLYLFRKVYGEAVTALPLNGGAYNVLLNTTSKATASIAACLTILSYTATGVVSASSAIAYFQNLWEAEPVTILVIVLLGLFAVLTLFGITDSAKTALVIFSFHISILALLVVASVVAICMGKELHFDANYHQFTPSAGSALYFGFASAMLGVTGFETSANFVEEQQDGVFVLTLRNMWSICAFFNPVLSLLTIALCPISAIQASQEDSLAQLGYAAAGQWLRDLVSLDAFIVLSGSVLTAYVGVNGLCRRLAMDRCMPGFLLAENDFRHTNHYIILGFFALCSSLYLMLNGDVNSLSNVYTISFLGVMSLFAFGDMLLKYKRNDIPRAVRASWPTVLTAFCLVIIALSGTIAMNPSILTIWVVYFAATGILMSSMFFRVQVLKFTHFFVSKMCKSLGIQDVWILKPIKSTIQSINSQPIGFFVKHPSLAVMNKAVLYVRTNEDCSWLRMIHVYDDESKIDPKFHDYVKVIDEMYPKIRIDLVLAKGDFSPILVDELSKVLEIPKNLMFLTCPKEGFSYKVSSLGGVRLITH